MAIAFGTAGAVANGTTSLSVAYPTSIAAGDLLVLYVINKYPTNNPSTPAGWVLPTNGQGNGGNGSAGVSSGNVYSTIYVRIADGTETGNLAVTITSGNSALGKISRFTKSSTKSWEWACANGAFNTGNSASWSATMGTDPGIAANDYLNVLSGTNVAAPVFSLEAIAATGCTFGALTERNDTQTSNGDDCHIVITEHPVSTGPSTAAAVYTMTASATVTNGPAGASVLLRLREVTWAGTAAATGSATALLTATGTLAASGSAVGSATSLLTATGSAAASASAVGAATGAIEGSGELSGSTVAFASTSGMVVGIGSLAGDAAAAGSAVAFASEYIDIEGTASASWSASGEATGLGDLSAIALVEAAAFGALVGFGDLSGLADAYGAATGNIFSAIPFDIEALCLSLVSFASTSSLDSESIDAVTSKTVEFISC